MSETVLNTVYKEVDVVTEDTLNEIQGVIETLIARVDDLEHQSTIPAPGEFRNVKTSVIRDVTDEEMEEIMSAEVPQESFGLNDELDQEEKGSK